MFLKSPEREGCQEQLRKGKLYGDGEDGWHPPLSARTVRGCACKIGLSLSLKGVEMWAVGHRLPRFVPALLLLMCSALRCIAQRRVCFVCFERNGRHLLQPENAASKLNGMRTGIFDREHIVLYNKHE